mmetsp:Transcript_54135/g.121373  ORF Transcript_54135/g.121373 Transcript_54135/m.121373 type:complete len:221 (+) Transcript_54135:736-1398(+)
MCETGQPAKWRRAIWKGSTCSIAATRGWFWMTLCGTPPLPRWAWIVRWSWRFGFTPPLSRELSISSFGSAAHSIVRTPTLRSSSTSTTPSNSCADPHPPDPARVAARPARSPTSSWAAARSVVCGEPRLWLCPKACRRPPRLTSAQRPPHRRRPQRRFLPPCLPAAPTPTRGGHQRDHPPPPAPLAALPKDPRELCAELLARRRIVRLPPTAAPPPRQPP